MRVTPASSATQTPFSRAPAPEEEDNLELELERKDAEEYAALFAPENTHYGGSQLESMEEDDYDEQANSEDQIGQFSDPTQEVETEESALLTTMVLDAYYEQGPVCDDDPYCLKTQISVFDDISIVYIQPNGDQNEVMHQKCVLESKIGSGQFSDVYRARLNDSPTPVAVKILKPHHLSLDKPFSRELQALRATLSHPATLDIIGYRGYPHYWLITPMMICTLHNLLEYRKLSPDEIIEISSQIVRIMDNLHRHGIMHRDLTPENLLFKDPDTLEICLGDFGLAEFVTTQQPVRGICLSPNGHPRYRAPEVSEGRYSFQAEVYNFGSCLYEMLTRKRPLHDIPDFEVGMMIKQGLRPNLPPHSEGETEQETGLAQLVERCWAVQHMRPTWAEIRARLEQLSLKN